MRWLITGGCGFIGRTLIRRIAQDSSASFRIVDNLSTGTREELRAIIDFIELDPNNDAIEWSSWARSRVEFVAADIREPDVARRSAAGAGVVVHLAANTGVTPSVQDPRRDCTTNVLGTLNYLEACRLNSVPRFVFASSNAPIGECEPPIHEELAAHPVSPYGASKLAGEAYCSAYARSFGVETVALRFANCYGPLSSHKSSVVAKYIREALTGTPWEIYGDGEQTRDFIFVEDLAEAIVLAATAQAVGGEVFQIATNVETTIRELATRLAATLKAQRIHPPEVRFSSPRVGDMKRNYSDTTKALKILGWRPRVSLDDGLNRTVTWFLEAQPKSARA
jgi:UDP-glucose 4-epimerase